MHIEAELDVNALLSTEYSKMYEDHRSTALCFTVRWINLDAASTLLDMLSLLLEYGANVNANIPSHPTTFPGAILLCMHHISMFKLLLDNGCDAKAWRQPTSSSQHKTQQLHMLEQNSSVKHWPDPFHAPWAGPIINPLFDTWVK